GVQAFSAQDCSDPTNVGGGVSLCQNTQLRLHRKSPTPRPIRQFGRRRRRGRHCGRPPASLRTSPGGTVRFNFFVLHDHVMVVLRPCEAKLSGLRCLTIIGTEGNGYSQRLIGSIRRECLDHVVVFGERHLRHLLPSYEHYYNQTRTHLSLNKDSPVTRSVETDGRILPLSILGGLHHQYVRI